MCSIKSNTKLLKTSKKFMGIQFKGIQNTNVHSKLCTATYAPS